MAKRVTDKEAEQGGSDQERPTADLPKLLKFAVSIPHQKEVVVEVANESDAVPAYLKTIGANSTVHWATVQPVTENA